MDTTVRELHGDEMLEAMFPLDNYAFASTPPWPDKAEWQEAMRKREGVTYFALFEEGKPVAGASGTPMTQNVRGTLLSASGIWGVATHPAARRRGYSRQVLAGLLASLRERGQAVSCLYPFRESFYERLGYVTFPLARTAKFTPSALLPLVKQDLGGEVQRVLVADGFDAYYDYVLRLLKRVHGMVLFDYVDREALRSNHQWLALAMVDGELVGAMVYTLKGDAVTEFNMRVSRFYWDTSQGKYLLLQWIARHADQANRVEMSLPPYEAPETWLADLQVKTESVVRAAMARVLDVARIGGMHTGPGSFSARVSDPLCPWNEGVWRLETAGGALRVGPAESADCSLSIQAIGALIYGTHDPGDFTFRGWGDPSPACQAAMRSMFPPMVPYAHSVF